MTNARLVKQWMGRLRCLTDEVTRNLGPGVELSEREQLAVLLLDNAYLMLADAAVAHTGEHPQDTWQRHQLVTLLRLWKQRAEMNLADDGRFADLFSGGPADDQGGN